ncbi:MAG: hypothetical protein E6J07_06410 [Chloroflexi bacterium]|nr:MAG: hypothetical protein E6J07_06410 [Chloroflexota bacterium]
MILFTAPLMLLVVDDLFVRQTRRAIRGGVALGVLATVQLLLWEELLLAEVLVGTIGIVVLLAFSAVARPDEPLSRVVAQRWRHAARGLAAAFITFLVLAGGPLAIQFFGAQAVHGAVWAPNQFVTDLLAFLTPTPLQALAPAPAAQLSEHFSATIYEWSGYLGIPLLALLGYAIASLWSRGKSEAGVLTGIFAVTGVFVALLSMGPLINVAGHTLPLPVALIALAIVFLVRRRVVDRGVRRAARILLWTFLAVWGATIFVPIVSDVIPARLMLFVFLFSGSITRFGKHARPGGRSRFARCPWCWPAWRSCPSCRGSPSRPCRLPSRASSPRRRSLTRYRRAVLRWWRRSPTTGDSPCPCSGSRKPGCGFGCRRALPGFRGRRTCRTAAHSATRWPASQRVGRNLR